VGDFQFAVIDQLLQGYGVCIDHGMHLKSRKCFGYYTREKKEYQLILKKTKKFEKSACFFLKSLLSYLSACERASIIELRWEVQ
jgi:hypothetical protein